MLACLKAWLPKSWTLAFTGVALSSGGKRSVSIPSIAAITPCTAAYDPNARLLRRIRACSLAPRTQTQPSIAGRRHGGGPGVDRAGAHLIPPMEGGRGRRAARGATPRPKDRAGRASARRIDRAGRWQI